MFKVSAKVLKGLISGRNAKKRIAELNPQILLADWQVEEWQVIEHMYNPRLHNPLVLLHLLETEEEYDCCFGPEIQGYTKLYNRYNDPNHINCMDDTPEICIQDAIHSAVAALDRG